MSEEAKKILDIANKKRNTGARCEVGHVPSSSKIGVRRFWLASPRSTNRAVSHPFA
jgi:hypothetical protein